MRYCILSDLHANLEALEAVLGSLPPDPYDKLVVLGDLVGYGADPNGVVDRVRRLKPDVLIRGNHDKVSAGIEPPEGFNQLAKEAARWTYDTLTPENRAYVANLPVGPVLIDELIEICHGAPYDEDAYIFDTLDALQALKMAKRQVCFFGHTHVPISYILSPEGLEIVGLEGDGVRLELEDDCKYLINPGSVGQPRDGDPRAAYALLDSDRKEVTLYRVNYQVNVAQDKITEAGLPEPLAHRLAIGR
jgi:predicted phosphodiesterase